MKHIPKERLCFYFGAIKKKESYETKIVSQMPFDLDDISGLGEDRWDRLKDMAVEYLKERKKLPSFAKEQDYEREGGCSYFSYTDAQKVAEILDDSDDNDEEIAPIVVFDNSFDNIILPVGYRERIIETIAQLKESDKIFKDWGLETKIKRGKGVNLLFSGMSGTGKTYCGEVIAEYIGAEAEIVSVASFESKWVGESEKNISQIFKSLKGGNKVLVLDEVDSFIRSRSETGNQYNTKLTNQFLIELERHNGICVMTTNRPVTLDKALQRRIDLVLDFPFPNHEARKKIWEYMIPDKLPTEKLDYNKLATYPLHGGSIRNCLLSTARKAVNKGIKKIPMDLFIEAIEEEMKEIETIEKGKDHS